MIKSCPQSHDVGDERVPEKDRPPKKDLRQELEITVMNTGIRGKQVRSYPNRKGPYGQRVPQSVWEGEEHGLAWKEERGQTEEPVRYWGS